MDAPFQCQPSASGPMQISYAGTGTKSTQNQTLRTLLIGRQCELPNLGARPIGQGTPSPAGMCMDTAYSYPLKHIDEAFKSWSKADGPTHISYVGTSTKYTQGQTLRTMLTTISCELPQQ